MTKRKSRSTSQRITFLEKFWVPIIVALIGLAGGIFSVVYSNKAKNAPTPTPNPQIVFYQVQVEIKGKNEYLAGAKVVIQVGGQAPLDGITDVNGIARIGIPASYVGQPGVLIVEADGYENYRQYIDLKERALPDVVQLESVR